ncbi:hypothetical protein HMN09_00021100 [Mycena chlorophos]|uniref:Uncharacterized protein n=1 Tax=Mycena chlorophos TaxID=658473 RepID=A0A8H6TNR6_MYCCL|nr:hypothetical protein HMN09_00021100 [Mycena chlorophos]
MSLTPLQSHDYDAEKITILETFKGDAGLNIHAPDNAPRCSSHCVLDATLTRQPALSPYLHHADIDADCWISQRADNRRGLQMSSNTLDLLCSKRRISKRTDLAAVSDRRDHTRTHQDRVG